MKLVRILPTLVAGSAMVLALVIMPIIIGGKAKAKYQDQIDLIEGPRNMISSKEQRAYAIIAAVQSSDQSLRSLNISWEELTISLPAIEAICFQDEQLAGAFMALTDNYQWGISQAPRDLSLFDTIISTANEIAGVEVSDSTLVSYRNASVIQLEFLAIFFIANTSVWTPGVQTEIPREEYDTARSVVYERLNRSAWVWGWDALF